MKKIVITDDQISLVDLIRDVVNTREPIQIVDKNGSAVLISEDDWRSIQETLCLLSIPGMRESICEGLDTAITDCCKDFEL